MEVAKRGRLDRMLFFGAPLTIRAPLTTPAPLTTRALLTTIRRPEAKFTSAACRMPSFNFLQPIQKRTLGSMGPSKMKSIPPWFYPDAAAAAAAGAADVLLLLLLL